MLRLITTAACLACAGVHAQITINSNHLPTGGDLLFARAATFLTEVDLESTGTNYTWNFGFDVLEPGALDAGTECAPMNSLSIVNQLLFNNFLYPEYDSDFGIGTMLIDNPFIAIEDAYQVYKNSGGVYGVTGIVATISGFPLAAQFVDRDIIYDLPLSYPASGNSHSVLSLDVPSVAYYGTDQYRNYTCDGWGTINIYDQSYDVLRVKSVVTGFDSVAVNFNGIPLGFQFPKDITTYQWISTSFKLPVLEVVSTAGGFGGDQLTVRTADINAVGLAERNTGTLSMYPNPAGERLFINNSSPNANYSIVNAAGGVVGSGRLESSSIATNHLEPGLYFLRVEDGNLTSLQGRFVKQ